MQTVLFVDVDSTIVENRFSFQVIGELLGEVAEATGLEIEQLGRELGQENGRRQREAPNHPLTMDWDDIAETVAARHGVTLSRRVIDLWHAYAKPEMIDVLDNAPEVLDKLKAPHRRLVIATKGLSKYQKIVLETAGLYDLFDDMLTPDITGYLKTQPDYFEKYRDEETRFIQIGDHFYDDVICAKRNDFYSVLRAPIEALRPLDPFERPGKVADYGDQISTYRESDLLPDAVVLSLEELPPVIDKIETF